MTQTHKLLLEKRTDERGRSWDVGRDPRLVSRDDLLASGHKPMSPLKALRARCVDCCADQQNEVRLCSAVTCPSWPFRMGSNPWREVSEGRREAGRRLAEGQAREAKNLKFDFM